MARRAHCLLAISVAVLQACTPPFQLLGNSVLSEGHNGPPVSAFVDHLRCEAYRTVRSAFISRDKDPENWRSIQYLYWYSYVAAGQLTLDVAQTEGLNPSVSFINPYTAMTNFTLALGGNLNGVQHRNIQVNLAVDYKTLFKNTAAPHPPAGPEDIVPKGIPPEVVPDHLKHCDNNDGSGIQGDLGLSQILSYGLGAFKEQDSTVFPGLAAASGASNVFGSQVDFTITEGLNVGPNWTLTHFKGPTGTGSGGSSSSGGGAGNSTSASTSGGSSGFVNVNRSTKDTLLISFAPACRNQGAPTPPPDADLPEWEKNIKVCGPSVTTLDLASVLNNLNQTLRTYGLPAGPKPPGARQNQNSEERPHQPTTSAAPESDELKALRAAQFNNTQILLQSISPSLVP